jgi:hypothetical protein
VSPGATGPSAPARPLDLPSAAPPTRPEPAIAGAGGSVQPAAQRPQQAQAARPTVQRRPPTRRLEPGDLICPDCGEGNPPTRKFCSRCGASVAEAEVVKARWWQKLRPRKGPKKREAGARPSARKTRKSFPAKIMGVLLGGVGKVVGVLFLIGGIVYGLVPNIRSSVNEEFNSIKSKITNIVSPTYTEIHPADITANSGTKQHGASLAVDGKKNTFWLSYPTTEPILTVTFSSKIDLSRIIVYNGATGDLSPGVPASFVGFARPGVLHLVFPETNKSSDVKLQDDPDQHTYSVSKGSGITRVEIHLPLASLNQPANSQGKKRLIAVTEIEFFKKD